ncbi:ketopantoate reductase family protein [Stackebrandtia nassauensis]|uniref:2-dehydropantoate 2-reductase n=1 Tax=Stackebrandtia nassauensis (strain DSM 44728 / CIP 108903 / NRRL B-16338 / NBRC 102104 / LLR-40K-21) TaxID=446470 RepID=D3Q117_STANL|nr:ketopantoate reductase family protein [Stackebrandtia nassauensis]ADD43767.1 2-dehydropantoate 2-reductase [Stackebrandtia nassauensis DSM 44728]
MRTLIVGAGAVGGYFGSRLVHSGQDVTFLVRPRRAELLRRRGLRVTGLGEDTVVEPRLVTAPELTGDYDAILLAVKATGFEQALADVAPAVGDDTAILPLLNGMAHLDRLNERFGPARVLGGVAKVMTTVDDEGDIVRLGPLEHILLGEQDGRPSSRVDDIHATLTKAGIPSDTSTAVLGAMWSKWVFISALGAVTTLLDGTVGEANSVPGGTAVAAAITREAAAIAERSGFGLSEAALTAVLSTTTDPDSPVTPSLYRDLTSGLPTEVEHLFGDLIARARDLGVDTPLLDAATARLRVHERRLAAGS